MKQLAIFQSDLGIGGIQKSLLSLLAYLQDKPVQIDLYLFREAPMEDLPIPANVTVIQRKRFPAFMKLLPFAWVRRLQQPFKSDKTYDLAIDYNGYWNECAHGALTVRADRRVCWIHSDLKRRRELNRRFRLLWLLSRSKYGSFDACAAVSQGAADAFTDLSGMDPDKIVVIPNLIDADQIRAESLQPIDFAVDPKRYNLVSVGSMNYYKGFDILVESMRRISRRRRDIHLYIIGDGPSRSQIEGMVRRLGLTGQITLLGSQRNPFPYLARMDGFVTASRFEGQGIAVMEALALGLDVFIPRHLEPYLDGVKGYDDLEEAIIRAEKRRVSYDFDAYNQLVRSRLDQLLAL
ncbi:MAG: glycosyltransferase [Bacillota bacterium]|nr:glycosyltransferase [Bacillota bacterium]